MPPRKSAFRQPGARHFQLVHRSQRDPLYQDPEASQRVLKEFERENPKKGKSRADLEAHIPQEDLKHDLERANIGEASLYGIYYDDTSYDYMQHFKQIGGGGDGFESVLLEGPSRSNKKGNASLALRDDLPAEALPSTYERPRNYEDQEAIPSSIAGFRPDMDPHLRQTLEALEDDAFVDDGLEDDFFGELIAEGEREVEEVDYDFDEDGFADAFAKAARLEASGSNQPDDAEAWEDRFAAFKKAQAQAQAPADEATSDFDGLSEGGDTVGTLPRLPVIGGKRRRKGTSDASGYSMSSSSMFRNEGLTTLDERFDQLEKEYAEDEEPSDDEATASDDEEEAPELITSREDFDAMMDDFLVNYEILGRKMKPVLQGNNPAEKLETYRRAFLEGGQIQVREAADDDDDGDILQPVDLDDRADRWDCETILSTYSNLENHPRLIRARDSKSVPKIQLDPRTGLPSVAEQPKRQAKALKSLETSSDGEEKEQDNHRSKRVTITRPKNESKEEKKARKDAIKAEKQVRRVDKKVNKAMFASAFKEQSRVIANQDERRVHAM